MNNLNLGQINDHACGTYNEKSQIKFKTSMLKSSLCDYSDTYILALLLLLLLNFYPEFTILQYIMYCY